MYRKWGLIWACRAFNSSLRNFSCSRYMVSIRFLISPVIWLKESYSTPISSPRSVSTDVSRLPAQTCSIAFTRVNKGLVTESATISDSIMDMTTASARSIIMSTLIYSTDRVMDALGMTPTIFQSV